MFLKVKRGMAEFSNPGLILVPQIYAGKSVMFQKLWRILVTLICAWLTLQNGGSRGKSRKCKTKTKPGRIINRKRCSWSKQGTCTTWANGKNRPFLNCSCYVLKQTLLGEWLGRTPLLTQTHRASFNRGIQTAVYKGNLFCFQIFLSLLQDVSLACHSDIGFP